MPNMRTIKEKLLEEYPNRIIKKISRNIYIDILNELKFTEYDSVKQFLEKQGYEVLEVEVSEEHEIIDKIKQNFKGNVIRAQELYEKNMYYSISKISKKKGIKIREFLEDYLNYNYKTDINIKSKVDYFSVRRIYNEYISNQREMVRLLNINRGTISNIINNKVNDKNTGVSWIGTELDNIEEEIILEMLVNKQWEKKIDGIQVNICCNGKGKLFLLFQYEDIKKIVFDEKIPKELHDLFDETKMSYLYSHEFKFFERQTYIHILDKRCILKTDESEKQWRIIQKNFREHGFESKQQYYEFLNVYGMVKKENSYEDLVEKFLNAANIDGNVATTNEQVSKIYRHFRHFHDECDDKLYDYRRFETFKEFAEYHGVSLVGHHLMEDETKEKRRKQTDDKYRHLLKEYLVFPNSNIVAFSSTDPIYAGLYQNARNRGFVDIKSYLKNLGYILKNVDKYDTDTIFQRILAIYTDDQERGCKELTTEQYERNRKLVKELKKAYEYRCQLCESENFFDIIMEAEEGVKYVEVHHIVPNSRGEDEEGSLDRPGNMIVVCPNHHRYLHYNKGGNYHLKIKNSKLFLCNELDCIEIKRDIHLKQYGEFE